MRRELWRRSLLPLGAAMLVACARGPKARAPAPRADVRPTASASSDLPPMSPMPTAGVRGSKKATRKDIDALATCTRRWSNASNDPAARVTAIARACAEAASLKPTTAVFTGRQGDRDPHEEKVFRAAAGHCYRVYAAFDPDVRELGIILRDDAGDIIAEASALAAPEAGLSCFAESMDVTLLVSVGRGAGHWAAQVWGD